MKRILLITLAVLCLAGCKKNDGTDLSVAGTTWKCKNLNIEYTMTFGKDNSVTVSQYDYEKNKKYWDDAHGTYSQVDGDIVFSLVMPEKVTQEHYLRGKTDGILMKVTIQEYLKGEKFMDEYTRYYQIKE